MMSVLLNTIWTYCWLHIYKKREEKYLNIRITTLNNIYINTLTMTYQFRCCIVHSCRSSTYKFQCCIVHSCRSSTYQFRCCIVHSCRSSTYQFRCCIVHSCRSSTCQEDEDQWHPCNYLRYSLPYMLTK